METNTVNVVRKYKIPKLVDSSKEFIDLNKKEFSGPDTLVADIVELINGERNTQEIIGELILSGHDVSHIYDFFEVLETNELLSEVTDSNIERFFDKLELDFFETQIRTFEWIAQGYQDTTFLKSPGHNIQAKLKNAKVVILGNGTWVTYLVSLLANLGIGHVDQIQIEKVDNINLSPRSIEDNSGPPYLNFSQKLITEPEDIVDYVRNRECDIVIYAPFIFDSSLAEKINLGCVEHNIPILFFSNQELTFRLGPLVIPGQSACFQCMRIRISAASDSEFNSNTKAEPPLALNIPFGIDALALEVFKHLSGIMPPLSVGKIILYDLISGLQEIHPVLKLPRCVACGLNTPVPRTQLWEK